MAFYLRNGFHPDHGISRGTMGLVTHALKEAEPRDVEAMAGYVVALMKAPSPERSARARELLRDPRASMPASRTGGGVTYERICAGAIAAARSCRGMASRSSSAQA
jgi:hypothetical protein